MKKLAAIVAGDNELVLQISQVIEERNEYKKALEEIRDGAWLNVVSTRDRARTALQPNPPKRKKNA